ncbi:MAG: ABC transporter ATP-binding protein [Deltaproteobacteria bacterium]|nr:ABC transporter ATP-binding protein [Deltaproteobacteria bacterium]
MIEIEHLTKKYKNVVAVNDLNLKVKRGEVFGFIGPNGAGKTTTIRILSGLLKPTSGKASIGGYDVTRDTTEVKKLVGYMPDLFGVYDEMRVWEYLDFFGAAYRISKEKRRTAIDRVLTLTDSEYMRDYYIGTLSRGMRQKVGLAKTLIHDPQVLILDEPASGLDPRARIELRDTIKNLKVQGKTILISSHILAELGDFCDTIGIIEKSRLLATGTLSDIMSELRQHIVIEIQVLDGLKQSEEILKAHRAVKSWTSSGDLIRVEFDGRVEEICGLLQSLVKSGVQVQWFSEVPIDLEEVFMLVTSQSP